MSETDELRQRLEVLEKKFAELTKNNSHKWCFHNNGFHHDDDGGLYCHDCGEDVLNNR